MNTPSVQKSIKSEASYSDGFKLLSEAPPPPDKPCLDKESYILQNNGGTYRLPVNNTRTNGDAHAFVATLSYGKLTLYRQENGGYTYALYSNAFSGPYGYHLRLNGTIDGPIKEGETKTATYNNSSIFNWGSTSSSNYTPATGAATLQFGESVVTVSISGGAGMKESSGGVIGDTFVPTYKSGSSSFSGSMTFPISYKHTEGCPKLSLSVAPDEISPKNQDGHFDTSTLSVSVEPKTEWEVTLEGATEDDGSGAGSASCDWSRKETSTGTSIPFAQQCSGDGEYKVVLEAHGKRKESVLKIDNTPPIASVASSNLVMDSKKYFIQVQDPVVGGFASGVESAEILEVLDGDGVSLGASSSFDDRQYEITVPAHQSPALVRVEVKDNLANKATLELDLPEVGVPGPGPEPGPGPRTPPGPVPESGRCGGAPCPKPESPEKPNKTPKPNRTPKPRPTSEPSSTPTEEPESPEPPEPTASPKGGFCPTQAEDPGTYQLHDSLDAIDSLSQAIGAEARQYSSLTDQWNKVAAQLPEDGFGISSVASKTQRQQEKLAGIFAELNDLYFDIQDDLSYLDADMAALHGLYQERTRESITLPDFSAVEPYAFIESLWQTFKDSRQDDNVYTEMAIVYQEMAFLKYLITDLTTKEVHSKNRIRQVNLLSQRIQQHKKYIQARPEQYDLVSNTDVDFVLEKTGGLVDALSQAEGAIAQILEVVGDNDNSGFNTQAIGPISGRLPPELRGRLQSFEIDLRTYRTEVKALHSDSLSKRELAKGFTRQMMTNHRSVYTRGSTLALQSRIYAAQIANFLQRSKSVLTPATMSLIRVNLYTLLAASAIITGLSITVALSLTAISLACNAYNVHIELDRLSIVFADIVQSTNNMLRENLNAQCDLYGDYGAIQQVIQAIFGNNNNELGGSLGFIARQLKNLTKVSSFEQFTEDVSAMDQLLSSYKARFLPAMAKQIQAACTHPCAEEIEQLELFLREERFNGNGNLSFFQDALYTNNTNGEVVRYTRDRETQYKNTYFVNNSKYDKIGFLAHILGRHGGSKNLTANIRKNNESMFYTDVLAIQMTLLALQDKFSRGHDVGYSNHGFNTPSSFHINPPYSRIPKNLGSDNLEFEEISGLSIGFGRHKKKLDDSGDKVSVVETSIRTFYRSDAPNSCVLTSVHPAWEKKE